MSQQQAQQQAQLAQLQGELAASIQEAQDGVEALLPSHKQDMALVELLVQKVEGARTKAAAALSSNSQAADNIDAVLGELQGCLARAAVCQQQLGTGAAKDECLQLLSTTNKLRQQLLRQSQVREGIGVWGV